MNSNEKVGQEQLNSLVTRQLSYWTELTCSKCKPKSENYEPLAKYCIYGQRNGGLWMSLLQWPGNRQRRKFHFHTKRGSNWLRETFVIYQNTKLTLFEHHVPGTSLDILQVLTLCGAFTIIASMIQMRNLRQRLTCLRLTHLRRWESNPGNLPQRPPSSLLILPLNHLTGSF